jgi:hypothetical protein
MKVMEAFGIKPYTIRTDIHNSSFKDNAFDLSLTGCLFEHFIGNKEVKLKKENCKISKKIICQVPENNLIYNLFRCVYTLFKGKWSFGFEVPVSKKKLLELFKKSDCFFEGEEYTNIITSILTKLSEKNDFYQKFNFRPAFYKFFKYDVVIACKK